MHAIHPNHTPQQKKTRITHTIKTRRTYNQLTHPARREHTHSQRNTCTETYPRDTHTPTEFPPPVLGYPPSIPPSGQRLLHQTPRVRTYHIHAHRARGGNSPPTTPIGPPPRCRPRPRHRPRFCCRGITHPCVYSAVLRLSAPPKLAADSGICGGGGVGGGVGCWCWR